MKSLKSVNNIKLSLSLFTILAITIVICISSVASFAQGEGSVVVEGVTCETQTLAANTENMSGDVSYKWQVSDTIDGEYRDIEDATSATYTLPCDIYYGKYVRTVVSDSTGTYTSDSVGAVGNLIELNITYGKIIIGDNGQYSYYGDASNNLTGDHNELNYYKITGTTGTDSQGGDNNICLAGTGDFNVILSNISIYTGNSSSGLGSPVSTSSVTGDGHINIYLDGNNVLKNISTSPANSSAGLEKNLSDSTIIIRSWNYNYSCHTELNDSLIAIGGADSAGIGGSDTIYNTDGTINRTGAGASSNITIMSGKIEATSTGSESAAIGAGNNSCATDIKIYGGDIEAIGFNNGAGIGGSGGDTAQGNDGEVYIYGGTINARSNNRGAGIGGGSSNGSQGGDGVVYIYGGNITVDSIGGGNSNRNYGGEATVNIYGGTIIAEKIGGGSSTSYGYGDASITITGGSIDSRIAGVPTDGINQVYLSTVTLYQTDVICPNMHTDSINNGTIQYGLNDVKTDNIGNLYLWLPNMIEITDIMAESDNYSGLIRGGCSGALKNNSTETYYTVDIGTSDRYRVYMDSNLCSEIDRSTMVQSNTRLSLYVKLNSDYSQYTVNAYKSKSNGTMEKMSAFTLNNSVYSDSFIVQSDTLVWFETIDTSTNTSRLDLDMTNGNIIIEEDATTDDTDDYKVTQNGYSISGYKGDFYITSKGVTTSNDIVLKSGTANILIDDVIANNAENVIDVRGGTLNLTYSTRDNQITSNNDSAINVEAAAILNISVSGTKSLKVYSGDNSPAIGGMGDVNITKNGGFLTLNKGMNSSSQIIAKNYSYTTTNNAGVLPYTYESPAGELIGYRRSSDSKLYAPNDVQCVSEETQFTAFTIAYYMVEGISKSRETILNCSYSAVLEGADSVIVKRNGLVLSGNDYTWEPNQDIFELSGAEAYGAVTVTIRKNDIILYEVISYNGKYDGDSHTIDIDFINPIDATVKYGTSSSAINMDDAPEYTDVGEYTIYYEITRTGFATISGNKTIKIIKANNEWINELICSSVVEGTAFDPQATSRWGTVIYKYSESLNGTYNTIMPCIAGEYYVRAEVGDNSNYNYLVSNPLKVNIEPYGLFMKRGRILEQLGEDDKVTNLQLSTNEIYTIKLDLTYIPDSNNPLKMVFSKNLSVGTALTLIDFSGSKPIYYDYLIGETTREILLTSFEKFATDIHFEEHQSGLATTVKYQINIQLADGFESGELTTSFYKGTINIPRLTATANLSDDNVPTGAVTLGSITSDANRIDIPLVVNATGTKKRVLCIQVMNSRGITMNYPTGTEITMNTSQGEVLSPTSAYSNFASFYLGENDVVNGNYTIELSRLKGADYSFKVSICDSDEVVYPMGDCLASAESEVISLTDMNDYGLQVTTMEGQERIVERNTNIDLAITYNVPSAVKLSIKSIKKNNGEYAELNKVDENFKVIISENDLTASTQEYDITGIYNANTIINVRLTAPNESGTYRYLICLGTIENEITVIPYNIIVK